jgi:hypothetical protein
MPHDRCRRLLVRTSASVTGDRVRDPCQNSRKLAGIHGHLRHDDASQAYRDSARSAAVDASQLPKPSVRVRFPSPALQTISKSPSSKPTATPLSLPRHPRAGVSARTSSTAATSMTWYGWSASCASRGRKMYRPSGHQTTSVAQSPDSSTGSNEPQPTTYSSQRGPSSRTSSTRPNHSAHTVRAAPSRSPASATTRPTARRRPGRLPLIS